MQLPSLPNSRLRREFASEEMNLGSVQSLIEDAQKARVTLDAATLEYTLRMTLERIAQRIRTDHSDVEKLQQLDTAAGLARSLPFEVNLWKIQNLCHELLQTAYRGFQKRAEQGDESAKLWVAQYTALAEKLSLLVV
jgi:hypothetical protein